ncbi:MAG: M28 family peptidase [Bacteroidetes bacterium]|nr:M28 family peptidase [Bacteroidota bacterium]
MFRILFFVLVLSFFAPLSQARSKGDRAVLRDLRADVGYLASDALQGRRTGTEGAHLAAEYIIARYQKLGIPAYGKAYRHPYLFSRGYDLGKSSITLNGRTMKSGDQAFPFAFSANRELSGNVLIDVQEQGSIWTLPLYANAEEANDPHFEVEKTAWDKTREAANAGASGVIFYDAYGAKYPPEFNPHSDFETLKIPAVFVGNEEWNRIKNGDAISVEVSLNIHIKKPQLQADNVAAFINNGAKQTVVIGAHYDHLGHGEDGGSLYAGHVPEIHNGADDNASGTAALMQIGAWLNTHRSKLNHYNYLLVHFSGEELGLFGSKAFAQESGIDSSHIAYMINMDMVGRLVDSSSALTVGGLGTSPSWNIIPPIMSEDGFRLVCDSSGVGPSDHTSFYHKGIPVLFFFTGTHPDYHKPTDDADKINYPGMLRVIKAIEQVVTSLDNAPRPHFTPTKESSLARVRFKVTLGIMPDYAFQGVGLRVDGVIDGRPAAHAGVQTGDIITRLGKDEVRGMQSYMEALSHQKTGNIADLVVQRAGKEILMKVQL